MKNYNQQVEKNLHDYYTAHMSEEHKMDNTILQAFLIVMAILWPVAWLLSV